jgi:quinol monooxygenase YgiN
MIVITRMIIVTVPNDKAAEAERLWKEECAPLMIKQAGCLSEEFLRGREKPGEFISLSTWENQQAIDKYRTSPAHQQIQQHTRALMGVSKVEVKTYDVVG